jgi:signal transduction histidine kinase
MNLQITLLLITASVNSLLSLFVLLGNRNKTNVVYSIFVLFASMWATGLAFFLMNDNLDQSLLIANFYYISAAGIPTFFLYFSLLFLNNNTNKYRPLITVPFLIIVLLFALDSNFLIKEVIMNEWGKNVIFNNTNYYIYSLYFVSFVIFAYFKLIRSYLESKKNEKEVHLKFIILGTFVGFVFGMVFNLFLPYIGDYKRIYLGPVFSIFMVASIAYSITKHHLFNMKVIVTQILMFVLWVFIFIRTILSSTSEDQIINGGLLLISVVVGTLLIKSVMREVQQREEIQKLADDLKLANQGQSSLMHFMNHQVKGRLGNVKNIFAELLTDDYGEMPRDAKPLLEKGLDEADIGVNYVQNILKGASAENGTLPYDMKPIDLKSLVTTAFEKQKDRAEKKELKFELKIEDGNYEMTGDAVQLGESIRNLIDNSLNYTPEGSVVVSLSNNSHIYRIEIKDTGVGLSSEDKLKLFKSGGRGEDSLKINVNSTGYGLVFVKGVVSAHGGKVWAESEGRGKGSTFIVELPKK